MMMNKNNLTRRTSSILILHLVETTLVLRDPSITHITGLTGRREHGKDAIPQHRRVTAPVVHCLVVAQVIVCGTHAVLTCVDDGTLSIRRARLSA